MATSAQILANRENAATSTGPRSAAGKAISAANATKSGLFTKRDFVLAEDRPVWEEMRASLVTRFQPIGVLEETFVNEIVSATWRLRRCGIIEAELQVEEAAADGAEFSNASYQSIDRARSQASRILTRSMDQLRNLQTERHLRDEVFPDQDVSDLGHASLRDITNGLMLRQRSEDRFLVTAIRRADMRQILLSDQVCEAVREERSESQSQAAKQTQSAATPATGGTL